MRFGEQMKPLQFLTYKTAGRPVGIWLAWLAVSYSIILNISTLLHKPQTADIIIVWPILVIAVVSLLKRRLIAMTFVGMLIVVTLEKAVNLVLPIDIILNIFAFVGLLINRCWFDEVLPNAGW